ASAQMIGASPWYRSPPAWIDGGTKSWPSVYIGSSGVMPAVSPKSYSNAPLVSVGHDDGSTASNRTDASFMNGSAIPPKFDPPPTQPTTTSGVVSPAATN